MKLPFFGFLSLAALVLSAPAALAATVNVTNAGNTFDPNNITIQVGDTVEWNWASGSHTVTSGTGAADPNAGLLFDSAWNSGNQTVSYTFNSPGTFDYFCRPHEGIGMLGTVTVQGTVPAMSVWAMLLLGLSVMGAGFYAVRRMPVRNLA